MRFFVVLLLVNSYQAGILSNIQGMETLESVRSNQHIKREIKTEKKDGEETTKSKPWTAEIKSGVPKIAISNDHCSLIKEFSLSSTNYESDCHLLYLPIEFISKHNQKLITAYLDSEKNELHEDQKSLQKNSEVILYDFQCSF
jgi:hypothetical protein